MSGTVEAGSHVTWQCGQCTCDNDFLGFSQPVSGGTIHCEVCETGNSLRNIANQVNARTGQSLCIRCTLLNDRGRHYCSACGSWLVFVSEPEQLFLSDFSSTSSVSSASELIEVHHHETDNESELVALMTEFHLVKLEHASNFRSLRAQAEFRDCNPLDLAEAVRSCGDQPDFVDFVSAHLNNQCPICFDNFPRHKMLQMASCQCKLCFLCFRNFVTTSLDNNDHVSHLQCPICNTPDCEDVGQLETHFQLLMLQVTTLNDAEIRFDAEKVSVLDQRLRDWNLTRDPSFRWCSHCPNGVRLPAQLRGRKFRCDQCLNHTCKDCRKQWQEQHEGIGCEQFQQWLVANDADFQEIGVAAFLQSSGIECPKCKFKYALAKGGCMHFTCRQCRAEFCSGCGGFFIRVNGRGLMCEHPRDCLYYLRDFDVRSLRKLLSDHVVRHETLAEQSADGGVCGVMEQKETVSGSLVDEACGRAVEGQSSLCTKHYTEYLVSLINRHRLDPVEVMDAVLLKEVCRRHGISVDGKISNDCAALRGLISQRVPLRC